MWVMVCFDLPTNNKEDRHQYALFRKFLTADGFTMFQESIYMRPCMSWNSANTHMDRVENHLPPKGNICVMRMTDAEFAAMRLYTFKYESTKPKPMCQLVMFDDENEEKNEDIQESEETMNEKQQRNEEIIPTSSSEKDNQCSNSITRKPLQANKIKQSRKKKRKKNDPPEGQLLFFF